MIQEFSTNAATHSHAKQYSVSQVVPLKSVELHMLTSCLNSVHCVYNMRIWYCTVGVHNLKNNKTFITLSSVHIKEQIFICIKALCAPLAVQKALKLA